MKRNRSLRIALASICLASGTSAQSATNAVSSPETAERLSDAELSAQRGGFRWQGLDIGFGAEMRSYLGGELVMQTNVSWTDTGTDVRRTVSATLSPAAAVDLRAGMLAGSGLRLNAGNDTVFLANQGQTVFIQRTDGAILNIIANTASNVDLRQEVDARLDIANFAPFQRDILIARIGAALSAVALVRGSPN